MLVRGAAVLDGELLPPTDAGWRRFLVMVRRHGSTLVAADAVVAARRWWGRSLPLSARTKAAA